MKLFIGFVVAACLLSTIRLIQQAQRHQVQEEYLADRRERVVFVGSISHAGDLYCARYLNSILVRGSSTSWGKSNDLASFRRLVSFRDDLAIRRSGTDVGNDAWYHSKLIPSRILPIARFWMLGRVSPGNDARNDTLLVPLSPVPMTWTVDDIVFAQKIAPHSRFVLIGDSNSSTRIDLQYRTHRELCQNTPDSIMCGEIPALLPAVFLNCDDIDTAIRDAQLLS